MKALVVAPNESFQVSDVPLPDPGPNEIRIKVYAVALNPVDALYQSHVGRIVGSDVAGVIDKVGSNVQARNATSSWGSWNAGDRVAGLLQGATTETPRPGGFAEYAILEKELAFLIPDGVTFEEAATVPLSALTTAQTLYIKLYLAAPFPMPTGLMADVTSPPASLLIYSAATSIGLFAFSFLRAYNPNSIRIYATASSKHHSRLRSLGASQVFDYRDPSWPTKVKESSGDTIRVAYDTISEAESTALTSQAFANEGGYISVVRSTAWDREGVKENVQPVYSAAWSGLGHEIKYNDTTLPANPLWREFTVNFYQWLSTPTQKGKFPIETIPYRLMPGGLNRIPVDGFLLLTSGLISQRGNDTEGREEWLKPISGEKLVYRLY